MAGHSKFKNIMHRKGAQDKKRSSLFSKLSREITVAAKMGLPDPAMNARLRSAIIAARAQSMPNDNIKRSIEKASGNDSANYEEVRYEGFGPAGVSLIIETLTDNRNRTATNVRTIVSKNGGNLGASGSVSHGFDRLGLITYPESAGDADKVFEAALEAGAEDVSSDEGHEIWCSIDSLHEVAKALEPVLGEAEGIKLAWRPQTQVAVTSEADAALLMKLIDTLDDDDDVQTVWGNYEVPDEVMEKLGLTGSPALFIPFVLSLSRTCSTRCVRSTHCDKLSANGGICGRPSDMLILGLDPGLGTTGWGMIRADGNRLSHVANGQIRTDASMPLPRRLALLHGAIVEVIRSHQPQGAAVEEVLGNSNAQSTLKLGQARGMALLAAAQAELVVGEYHPSVVKKAVVGTGGAAKEQVQAMVARLLPGVKLTGADAADALAVAITHAHHLASAKAMLRRAG